MTALTRAKRLVELAAKYDTDWVQRDQDMFTQACLADAPAIAKAYIALVGKVAKVPHLSSDETIVKCCRTRIEKHNCAVQGGACAFAAEEDE